MRPCCPLCKSFQISVNSDKQCECLKCKIRGHLDRFTENNIPMNDISQGKVVANSLAPDKPIGVITDYKPKANDVQHGGKHYKTMAIQPWDYIVSNKLGYLEGNAVKYLSRWREKNGVEDLRKAIHYIEKLIEIETNEKQSINPPNNQTTT